MINSTYLIIPERVAKDQTLTKLDKLIFGKIYGLSKKDKYCWSSNSYLADYFNVKEWTISRAISSLTEKGYLKISYNSHLKNDKKRKIYINYNILD